VIVSKILLKHAPAANLVCNSAAYVLMMSASSLRHQGTSRQQT